MGTWKSDIWGVVGIIVDYSTGHINEVTTLKIIATLEDEN